MLKKISFVFFLSVWLASCSQQYATKGEQLYLKSKNEEPLKVASPLTEKNIHHDYDLTLPNRNPLVSLAPPDSEIKQA